MATASEHPVTKQQRFILNSNLRWFLLAMILANIAGQMGNSMMSLYLVDLGATVPQVGLVFTLAALVPVALQILGGWLSDTIGRLRAIALGSSVTVFGWLILVLSRSWPWVLLGLCLDSVSRATVGPSFGAYIAEQSTEDQRGRVFGVTKGIFMIVGVIGPALGGLLAYRFSFRTMILVAFAFFASATALRIWMATAERFAPPRSAQKPTLAGLRTEVGGIFALLFAGGILTWIWVTDAINDTAFSMIQQLYPIYLADIGGLNLAQIGLLNSASGVATILAALLAGWLTDKLSERVVIVGALSTVTLGLIALLQASSFAAFLLGIAIFGLGAGGLTPAYDSLVSKVVPESKRGLAFGLFGTSLGILSLPFPWIGAQLWQRVGPQAPFWLTVVASAISIPIAAWAFVLPKRRPPDGADEQAS